MSWLNNFKETMSKKNNSGGYNLGYVKISFEEWKRLKSHKHSVTEIEGLNISDLQAKEIKLYEKEIKELTNANAELAKTILELSDRNAEMLSMIKRLQLAIILNNTDSIPKDDVEDDTESGDNSGGNTSNPSIGADVITVSNLNNNLNKSDIIIQINADIEKINKYLDNKIEATETDTDFIYEEIK